MKRIKEEVKSITIRFPLPLWKRIIEMAEKSHRSFNLQVVWIIHQWVKEHTKEYTDEV